MILYLLCACKIVGEGEVIPANAANYMWDKREKEQNIEHLNYRMKLLKWSEIPHKT